MDYVIIDNLDMRGWSEIDIKRAQNHTLADITLASRVCVCEFSDYNEYLYFES